MGAYAAITNDGKVITWGSNDFGGDSSKVSDQLYDITKIVSTPGAFTA